jgi:2'-5' RNA ligase
MSLKIKACLTLTEEELKKLLKELKKARRKWWWSGVSETHFCINCMREFDWTDYAEYKKHEDHITTVTNAEHDGIGEWIRAVEWVLYGKTKKKGRGGY